MSIFHEVGDSALVYETETAEWWVKMFREHMVYAEASAVSLPKPWYFPTRQDAATLHTCEFYSKERFITEDGYTFGMPSASVTKAGAKTKYSVLGLYIRPKVIVIDF